MKNIKTTGEPHLSIVPFIPPDARQYMDKMGFELHNSYGDWWVSGEEGGEPFELGLGLFLAIYERYYKGQEDV